MLKRSKKAVESTKEAMKNKFIVNGEIDHAAVRAEAEKNAKNLYTDGHLIYKTEADMADGFEKEILDNLK